MTVTNLRDFFVHNVEDIYYAEKQLLDALQQFEDQTEDEDIAQEFSDHREETEEHIERLEKVFEKLDKEPEKEECEAIEGLLEEHKGFADKDPDQRLLDLHNLVAAQKVEHYEIASYGNLALLADRLDMDEAGDLLHKNLEDEEEALDTLSSFVDDYDYEEIVEASAD
ncbi:MULTISPECIES: ferritin-like domain-containing protein [unclassified Haladaptatus]|uniref:YciE/YciF ferroxidase family protein n=1 Tax=unclassified Haladaptatus TaxID=2622732 RepID=UPI0023E8F088|nr:MULTISPECIES: DUF892 family protein [unclassified Haladaptatus]